MLVVLRVKKITSHFYGRLFFTRQSVYAVIAGWDGSITRAEPASKKIR